ncbi:hypothetical protein BH09MYX1_BH09MYX1_66710 [soil metagenome]
MRFDAAALRHLLLVLLVVAPAGCIIDWNSVRGGGSDASADVPDGDDGGVDAPPDGPPCKLQLLINEVEMAGALGPSDEFVELRNDADCEGSLGGYELRYSSAGGSSPNAVWTGTTETIPAKGYVVLGGKAFQGQTNVVGRWKDDVGNGVLSATGGGVGLFGPDLLLVDSVAYETLSNKNHPFLKPQGGLGAPNPGASKSIARIPDGTNTSTNATDFKVGAPTPGASN